MGMLLITHDIGVVASIAERMAVMHSGEIVESGTADAVFARPLHPYTRALLTAAPGWRGASAPVVERATGDLRGGCRFKGRCPDMVDQCDVHPELSEVGHGGRSVRCWVAQSQSLVDAEEMAQR